MGVQAGSANGSMVWRFPDLPPALPVAPSCPSPPQSPRFGREKSSRLWKDCCTPARQANIRAKTPHCSCKTVAVPVSES
eukprot:2217459-Amphidinium_carterae.2